MRWQNEAINLIVWIQIVKYGRLMAVVLLFSVEDLGCGRGVVRRWLTRKPFGMQIIAIEEIITY